MHLDPAHFAHAVGYRAPIWPYAIKPGHRQAEGLELCWRFDTTRGPGTSAFVHDLSPFRRQGVYRAGDGIRITERAEHAVAFIGNNPNNHRVETVANGDGFDFGSWDELTLVCDYRHDVGAESQTNDLVSHWHFAGGSTKRNWVLTHHNNNQFFFEIGGEANISGGTVDSSRRLVVATYSAGSGFMRLYVDGVEVASTSGLSGNLQAATGILVKAGAQHDAASNILNGEITEVRIYRRCWSAREVWALYDPQTRWSLYRELRVPWLWPAAGGATTRSGNASLQAALQRQVGLPAAIDAAVRAEAVLTALADAALARVVPRSASLDAAMRAVVSAQADLEAALTRSLDIGAGLDANLSTEGLSQRTTTLDSAIRRLNVLSGTMEAALRASKQGTAEFDAPLALIIERAAGLDAAARLARRLSDSALQAVLRATPDRAAALDAVIGTLVAAAESRTFKVAARGRHAAAGGQRSVAIPSGNRRH